MRAVVSGIAVCLFILGLGGACSAGGPSGKQPCHCAQQDGCKCPLPASQHAGNKPAGPAPAHQAERIRHHKAHMARHERRLERREARIERRQARIEGHEAHGGHGRNMEHREARLNRWEGWIGKREARMGHGEATTERRDGHHWGWRDHEHFRFYRGLASLPYGYRSTSRHYAMRERFRGLGMHERFAMRGYSGSGGYSEERFGGGASGGPDGYSGGRGYGPAPEAEGDQDRESGYADEGPGPEYGDEGPGPGYGEGEGDYAAAGGGSMSINSPAALDSWHGYGVDCPPYE
jgi:hypothetical protein